METLKTKQGSEEQKRATELMAGLLPENKTVFFSEEYVGNRGTCYVRAHIIRNDDIQAVTAIVAGAIGETAFNKDGRWSIRTSGYGYSRAQHVADALSYALFGERGLITYRVI